MSQIIKRGLTEPTRQHIPTLTQGPKNSTAKEEGTIREVVAVVNRPQDIEDEEAMSFFGASEGDADESQG